MALWSSSDSVPGSRLSNMFGRLELTMCSVVFASAEALECMMPKAYPRESPAPKYINFSSKVVPWVLFACLPVYQWNHRIFIAFSFYYFRVRFKYRR